MPNLLQFLQSQDPGYLRILAELWGLDIQLKDMEAGAQAAVAAMLDTRLAGEIIEALDAPSRAALDTLIRNSGRVPWSRFVREFGDVREMGAGRRDREQPHLHPISATEVLFYRGLLGRAFFDTHKGPQEFAYVPDDLLALIRPVSPERPAANAPVGRPAGAAEHKLVSVASDGILDDATTLLAALRTNRPLSPDPVLRGLLESAGILKNGAPQAARVKDFLERPRGEALRLLVEAWRGSEAFNELRLMPGLTCEGSWINQPRAARQFLLSLLQAVRRTTWWNLQAFIGGIKQQHADFQRPAGDYDSWFIKSAVDGSYLRGYSSWDQVDGALVRFVITDVMHRLGLLDLGRAAEGQAATAFRIAAPQARQAQSPENGQLHIGSHGGIAASRQVPRSVRYQLARFCEWDDEKAGEFRYHVTPRSLTQARGQGLKVEHLLTLLANHSGAGVPPAFVRALKRWESNGTEAQAETQAVLKVRKPEILQQLRKSRAAKYLGEALGPTTVVVKSGAMRKVIEAMTEVGLLMEDKTDGSG
jgi:hypothetical protein